MRGSYEVKVDYYSGEQIAEWLMEINFISLIYNWLCSFYKW